MGDRDKNAISRLDHLSTLRQRLLIRANLLPADLALLGLVDDLLGAAFAVVSLSDTTPSTVIYPLARTAFEASQRIIALASDDDYLRTGARAWLYYHRKDMRILRIDEGREAAEVWFHAAVGRLRDIWKAYYPQAETILAEENERLRTNEDKRGPDNFMCRDLAPLVQERYPRIFPSAGMSLSELESVNRAIYAFLCRDSHARLRVDPIGYRISPDGAVTVVPRQIDDAVKRDFALRSLDSSVSEAVGALSYFLGQQERERAEQLRRTAAHLTEESIPEAFDRDFGLHLAACGVGRAALEFLGVAVQRLNVLPDGTVTWSAGKPIGEEVFLASFDAPVACVPDLARALGVQPAVLRGTGTFHKHTLPRPARINLRCRLGSVQRTATQTFIPLKVERVSSSDDERV